MKQRVALVRGPNLNRWEMQNFLPLQDAYQLTGFTSYEHNFPLGEIPFEVRKLFSLGQSLRARFLRAMLTRFWGDYHDLQGLRRSLGGFHIVHAAETSYYCTYQAALAKKTHGYRLVVTVWENIPFSVHLPATRGMKEVINRETDLFLAVTERTRQILILEGAPPEKVQVLMPGVDVEHFRPRPRDTALLRKFGCEEDDQVVLYVANLYWEKGIFDLLVAFRRAWEHLGRPARLKLLIGGRGREQSRVQEWIRLLSLEGRALLIGSHPYSVMPAVHSLADLFVLPSIPTRTWQEQFGYVLVESMASGKPVVTTRCGSIPEVVGDAARLVEPADFLGLAGTLEELLGDPSRRAELGTKGRKRAEALFSVRTVSEKLRSLYASLA
ncbi:MAG TPA: glycosyltransferase family 4 protein [Bacteroidota bacterium]